MSTSKDTVEIEKSAETADAEISEPEKKPANNELTEKLKEEKEAALRLERNGEFLMDKNRFEEALDFFRRAAIAYKKIQDKELLGRIYFRQAQCYELSQKLSDAQAFFNESKKYYKSAGNLENYSITSDRIAKLHFWQGKTRDAIAEYKDAIEHGCAGSEIYNNLAFLQMGEEDFDAATENLKKSLELRDKEESTEKHITLNNLGIIEYLKGNYKEAEDFFEKGIENDKRLPEDDRSVQYLLLHKPMYKEQSFKNYHVAEDVDTRICLKLNLAAAKKALKADADIEDLLKDALDTEGGKGYTHEACGWFAINGNDEKTALDHFRKALPYDPANEDLKTVIHLINPYLDAAVGRNDPCPCGSGKKFKKCHGSVV